MDTSYYKQIKTTNGTEIKIPWVVHNLMSELNLDIDLSYFTVLQDSNDYTKMKDNIHDIDIIKQIDAIQIYHGPTFWLLWGNKLYTNQGDSEHTKVYQVNKDKLTLIRNLNIKLPVSEPYYKLKLMREV